MSTPVLYNIAEDPSDEGWGIWVAVWATRNDEALAFAYDVTEAAHLEIVDGPWTIDGPDVGDIRIPSRETRPAMLRILGWHQGDELYCGSCDMAPMGLPQYAVCPDCELCRECADQEIFTEDRCHCVI